MESSLLNLNRRGTWKGHELRERTTIEAPAFFLISLAGSHQAPIINHRLLYENNPYLTYCRSGSFYHPFFVRLIETAGRRCRGLSVPAIPCTIKGTRTASIGRTLTSRTKRGSTVRQATQTHTSRRSPGRRICSRKEQSASLVRQCYRLC